jgi:glycosyltransferase involved in cell wall biosynthesis
MRVLLVNCAGGWGGAQESVLDLGAALSAAGVEVQFAARDGSRMASRLHERGARVHAVPGGGVRYVAGVVGLARAMRRERFDIVSVEREHDLTPAALARALAFPLGGGPRTVATFRHPTSHRQPLLGAADAVVCISAHVRDRLLSRHPGAAERTLVLHNGVPVGGPPPAGKFDRDRRRRFFTERGFPLIGMVGDLWKNQAELLDAVPAVAAAFPTVTVAFVGGERGGRGYLALERAVSDRGLGARVILTGHVPRERIPDVFYDLDVSVTTHRNEGFGRVIVESLVAGTPVVGYDAGSVGELLRAGDVGAAVRGGPAELAAAIVRLLADDERRARLGREAYVVAKREFATEVRVRRYLAFYERLLTRRPASAAPAGALT